MVCWEGRRDIFGAVVLNEYDRFITLTRHLVGSLAGYFLKCRIVVWEVNALPPNHR
jgi:hypothetical protein